LISNQQQIIPSNQGFPDWATLAHSSANYYNLLAKPVCDYFFRLNTVLREFMTALDLEALLKYILYLRQWELAAHSNLDLYALKDGQNSRVPLVCVYRLLLRKLRLLDFTLAKWVFFLSLRKLDVTLANWMFCLSLIKLNVTLDN